MKYIPLLIAGLVIVAVILVFLYASKKKKLDQVRAVTYKLFVTAEVMFSEPGSGATKMAWVFEKAYILLPNWIKMFVSEEKFKMLLQKWFDEAKDWLDDGVRNGSTGGMING